MIRLLFIFIFTAAFSLKAFSQGQEVGPNAVCASDQGTDVYGYDVCVWPTYSIVFNDEYGLRAVYKSTGSDEWTFLSESTHFIANFTDTESTDAYFQGFVNAINTAIESKLRPVEQEADSGIERIKWLAGKLVFANDSLQSQ